MGYERAVIETETKKEIPLHFNPDSLSFSRRNSWARADPASDKTARFTKPLAATFTLGKILFDTTSTGDPVTEKTQELIDLMDVDESLPKGKGEIPRPPWVRFRWGKLLSFKMVIASADVNIIMFAKDGTPLRADIDLKFEQFNMEGVWGAQNPTSGTVEPHGVHRIQPGETLDRIAAGHYGQSSAWRDLAEANGIEDPMALRPGTLIRVPRRGDQ